MKLIHALGLLLALGATSASASTVFTYTGNLYEDVSNAENFPGTYTQSMRVTMSFEFAAPPVANTPYNASNFSAFSISDGRGTFTSESPVTFQNVFQWVMNFNLPTNNAPGVVASWDILYQDIDPSDTNSGIVHRIESSDLFDHASFAFCIDAGCNETEPGDTGVAGSIGVWTITETAPVPIPPAIWFLGSAMAAVGLMRRRMV